MELEPYDPDYNADDASAESVSPHSCGVCCDSGTYYTWNGIELTCECWAGVELSDGTRDYAEDEFGFID